MTDDHIAERNRQLAAYASSRNEAQARDTRTCPRCGSDDVSKDACARWDASAGAWALGRVYDSETCNACGAEGDWLTATNA